MTEQRKGQIAYAILKYRMAKEGISLNREEFKREIGNLAKATNIDGKELSEFAEMIIRDLVEETFGK